MYDGAEIHKNKLTSKIYISPQLATRDRQALGCISLRSMPASTSRPRSKDFSARAAGWRRSSARQEVRQGH